MPPGTHSFSQTALATVPRLPARHTQKAGNYGLTAKRPHALWWVPSPEQCFTSCDPLRHIASLTPWSRSASLEHGAVTGHGHVGACSLSPRRCGFPRLHALRLRQHHGEVEQFPGWAQQHRKPLPLHRRVLHNGAPLKAQDVGLKPLHTCWGDLQDLLAVEPGKLITASSPVEVIPESHQRLWRPEVDKAVPNIASVPEINWKIQKVNLALVATVIKLCHQLVSHVLVWDVPQHRGRASL
mmetsp:Transcript_20187/g.47770  ORF Transcript_20187/g.47770 Transcript_20187/m.47770 type:complete len:240 (-) Transcript_20187:476-1195(-)